MKWKCNVYPGHTTIWPGRGVEIIHADCTELVPRGVVGDPFHPDEDEKDRFMAEGIIGVYIANDFEWAVNPNAVN